jgi:predicted phosphodiesterase
MTALIIADDEYFLKELPVARADVLIVCGDLADADISSAAERCGRRQILAVKGNHDSGAPFRKPIVDLHLRTVEFQGLTFGGFCGAWRYKPVGHYLFEQHEVERMLSNFPRVDIFVTHNSPRLIHERDEDVHVGFAGFNTYGCAVRPDG